jgi:hypothetical protein
MPELPEEHEDLETGQLGALDSEFVELDTPSQPVFVAISLHVRGR